jgi:hypothetical protein
MKRLRLLLSAAGIAAIAMAASSQTTSQPSTAPESQAPHVTVSFAFGPAGSHIAPKPGAPFSAVLVSHTDQTLSDGTMISRDDQEVVMRRTYAARTAKIRD